MTHPPHYATFFIAACAIWTGANAQTGTAANANNYPVTQANAAASTPVPVEVVSCKNPAATQLSRFWELEPASDCGTFGLRGYRPISLAVIGSDSVNTAPTSPAADHTGTFQPYTTSETRINLSVRTKIAQGLLTAGDPNRLDSLWFAYSQQSYWQLFNADLSRPFRATDHEPELIYIFPLESALPSGWRLRYGGIGINHQSNGQSLPLSRSWNRIIGRAGLELGNQVSIAAAFWQRVPEDSASDDNPDIVDRVGRAELSTFWNVDAKNSLVFTVRHSLQTSDSGSLRLAWFRKIGNAPDNSDRSNLRLHTELFSGYGDSLMDYNRKRTVFSVGLTLLDW
ncbi:phospholipase A [Rhodoferax mekongensis]|uniref:Phospholipase A1 n=1 Tax=Rhodoferax mekongensis TaxID=3068341 RepID=A0ABZ0B1N9_9BURK|nr:phospholipase A [Rhodoferax sp. TBRC 17307]WNO04954.1 phospholipase A [Rhodoferax sp. TBRC 17307]